MTLGITRLMGAVSNVPHRSGCIPTAPLLRSKALPHQTGPEPCHKTRLDPMDSGGMILSSSGPRRALLQDTVGRIHPRTFRHVPPQLVERRRIAMDSSSSIKDRQCLSTSKDQPFDKHLHHSSSSTKRNINLNCRRTTAGLWKTCMMTITGTVTGKAKRTR